MSQDTVNRQVYNRLFKGSFEQIADTSPSDLIGAVFDKTLMPALLIDPGKQVYYNYTLLQAESVAVPLPPEYSAASRLYIAVQTDLKARVVLVSPTHGSGTTLLKGTDSTTLGTHASFWSFQGDVTSLTISVPSTADGGATTSVQVFMYEIPDLADFESYFDKQIGLGVSGD